MLLSNKKAMEAAKKAQAAQRAAEDAQAAAAVMLSVAKYDALVKLNEHAEPLKKDATELSLETLVETAEAAGEAINNAEDEEPVAEALKEGKEALDVAVCPAKNFTDVDLDAWYHDAVDYVLHEGIMNGNGNATFTPNGALSSAAAAQIMMNYFEK